MAPRFFVLFKCAHACFLHSYVFIGIRQIISMSLQYPGLEIT